VSAAVQERTATVLVVDDEEDIRLLVRMVLEREHYRVLEAGDGREALDVLEAGDPVDLVLLDLRMAPLDGWAVLARLRDSGLLQRVRVLVVSAHAGPALEQQALAEGGHGFLTKPFAAAELLDAMHRVADEA
jgi:CheY-like chemotaxis protein